MIYTNKPEIEDVKKEFSIDSTVEKYSKAVYEIGLWKSEEIVFDKYVSKDSKILDIGCGGGRTTFNLYKKNWKNIKGIDLSQKLIEAAQKSAKNDGYNIIFEQGDATCLKEENSIYDLVLFSFNGLFCIPNITNRQKVLNEAFRVLKKGGIFIFTSHDRDLKSESLKPFWEKYNKEWDEGKFDNRIIDYGDIFPISEGREIYIHIPSPHEVKEMIKEAGFTLIETIMRSEICEESEVVKEFSVNCRFWIIKK